MKRHYFTTTCPAYPKGYNKGEQVEWKVSYELTGKPSKRNNRPGRDAGDVDGWQVKSPKASMAENDNCKGYIFGFADSDYYYSMSKEEFEIFLTEFSYLDKDSKSGKAKIRIKNDTKKMREWLQARA